MLIQLSLNMEEKIKWKGYFYQPAYPKDQLPGILTFDQEEGIELELFGQFDHRENASSRDEKILLGFTSEGKKLTLFGCFGGQRGMNIPGFPTSSYSAIHLFVGAHFEEEEDIQFNSCAIEYADINQWLGITGFDHPRYNYEKNELQVNYKQPERICFQISADWRGEFEFAFFRPLEYHAPSTEVNIRQAPLFHLKPDTASSFKIFYEKYSSFNSFLALNFFTFPRTKEINFYIDKEKAGEHDINFIRVQLYFKRGVTFEQKENRKSRHDFLVEYKNYGSQFEAYICKWYKLANSVDASVKILTETLMKRGNPMQLHFISLVQALENFHRRIIFPGQRPLNSRLDEIVNRLPLKTAHVLLSNEVDFTKRVTKNRNYFTHYSADNEKHAASLSELFILSEKLKIICIVMMLRQIEFDDEQIDKMILTKGVYLFNHIISTKKYADYIQQNW
jgi:hypothetical protein